MFYTYYVKAEGKYYFGSRTPEIMLTRAAKDDFMIHYFTSTTDERLREIIRKGEYEKAEIIKEYTNRQECLKDEELLIENFWWLYGRLNCWNRQANGKFSMSGTHPSDETRQKHKEAWENKSDEEKEEIIEKCRNASLGEGNGMYGKHHSEEAIKKISEAKKEEYNNKSDDEKQEQYKKISEALKGEGNGMYGKHHSEEAIKKISEAKKGKTSSFKGKHHSEEAIKKISEARKGKPAANKGMSMPKYKWQTPDGEVKIMSKGNAVRHHPDWTFIGLVES